MFFIKLATTLRIALLMLYLQSYVNSAEAQIIFRGAGTSGCGEWVSSRTVGTASTSAAINMEGWVLGYLSGVASSSNRDLLRDVDATSLFLWLDNYCKANPLQKVWYGATQLSLELENRIPNKKR